MISYKLESSSTIYFYYKVIIKETKKKKLESSSTIQHTITLINFELKEFIWNNDK